MTLDATLLCESPTTMEVTAEDGCTGAVARRQPARRVSRFASNGATRRAGALSSGAISSENAASPCRSSMTAARVEKTQVKSGLIHMLRTRKRRSTAFSASTARNLPSPRARIIDQETTSSAAVLNSCCIGGA